VDEKWNILKKDRIVLQFKDFHKTMRVPFAMYADFEALAAKIDTIGQI
jgi:hypothetical protein